MAVSKAVLITGCSSGIGRATAVRLVDVGWRVYATARNPENIAPLEERGCVLLPLDVTDEDSMVSAVDEVERRDGAVGVLVNNAGYSQSGAVEAVPMDNVRRQFETNVFGVVKMCQLVLPGMRRQGFGRIVNVSSMGGKLTFPGAGYYHASKHAVEAISDALRFEVEGFGIGVSVIAGFDEAVARTTTENYERGPFARLGGGPETVAEAIERAISAQNPRSRYAVTPSAHLFLWLRRVLPDRAWDAALKTTYPQPGR
jgi:NAD(P)-dependent dehydrogenase (short-subunit alcohol dehydrogenase family)